MRRSSRTNGFPVEQASRKRHNDKELTALPRKRHRTNKENQITSAETSGRKVFSHIAVPTPSRVLALKRDSITNNGQIIGQCPALPSPTNHTVQGPIQPAHLAQEFAPPPYEADVPASITNQKDTTIRKGLLGPSIGPLHSRLDIDSCRGNCRVLSFFGLFHDSEMIICTLHPARLKIVPLSGLSQHLHRSHKFSVHRQLDAPLDIVDNSISRANVLQDFVAHISTCCGVPLTQSIDDVSRILAIQVPIKPPPGISDATQAPQSGPSGNEIQPRLRCPAQKCDFWSSITTSKGSLASELIRHTRHKCKHCGPAEVAAAEATGVDAPRPQFVQRLSICGAGKGKGTLYRFLILPEGWALPTSKHPPPHSFPSTPIKPIGDKSSDKPAPACADSEHPVWVKEADWVSLRRQLGRYKPETLKRLIEPPSSKSLTGEEGAAQYVEKGLIALKCIAWTYLAEANAFIGAQALDVGLELGKGLFQHFKVRSPKSLYKPRSMLISVFGLLLRTLRAMQEQDMNSWGGFRLRCSVDQLEAAQSLYDLIIETKGSPDSIQLQKAFHQVCVALLQPKSLSEDVIACPTEQVLFIFSIAPSWRWVSGARLYERCGALQLIFQLIFIQNARLTYDCQGEYRPWSVPGDVSIPEESWPEGDEPGMIPIEEDLFNDDADYFYPGVANQSSHLLLATIQSNINYISARTSDLRTTPVSRLKTFGSLVFKAAQEEWSSLASVSNQGYEVTVVRNGLHPVGVNLFEWSYAALQAIAIFLRRLSMLLPPGYLLEDFDFHRLTDNYSPDALFKQRDNAVWLDPFCQGFHQDLIAHLGLTSKNVISTNAAIKWFNDDQAIQEALAVVFVMSCGIVPPQHEYRILWDSSKAAMRCIFLTPDKTVIVVNPSARPKDDDFIKAVYALPEIVAPAVMYYLTVVRPAACDMLNLMGRDGNDSAYATEIWAHYCRQGRSSYHWNGPEISRPVQQHTLDTLGISWSPGDIRKTVESILRRYLPDLVVQARDSLIDQAAQHTSMVSLNHYGRLASFPPLPHLRHDQPIRSVTLCHIWQGILGLGPLDLSQQAVFHGVSLLPRYPWLDDGLQYARAAIYFYEPQNDSMAVERTLRLQPFVYGPRMEPVSESNPWVDLGDEVLTRVIKSMLNDPNLLPMIFAPVHSHLGIELVAYAVCLIIRALNEWIQGIFVDLSTLNVESDT